MAARNGHRPERHIAIIDQTLEHTLARAAAIGVATAELIRTQARRRLHPEETLRSAQGILRLAHDFSAAELERACERALVLKAYSYRAVRTLITTPATTAARPALDLPHENLRGAKYFE